MTIEELRHIMHQLQLDFDATPRLIYVFYQNDKGLVNNFTISLQAARQRNRRPMTAEQIAAVMQQYPDARNAQLIAVEHPTQGLTQWMDTPEVCQKLHTTRQTLSRWTKQGLLHPARLGHRLYFDAGEIDSVLRSNIIQPNGRLDKTGT